MVAVESRVLTAGVDTELCLRRRPAAVVAEQAGGDAVTALIGDVAVRPSLLAGVLNVCVIQWRWQRLRTVLCRPHAGAVRQGGQVRRIGGVMLV